jgi:hypothetical protein
MTGGDWCRAAATTCGVDVDVDGRSREAEVRRAIDLEEEARARSNRDEDMVAEEDLLLCLSATGPVLLFLLLLLRGGHIHANVKRTKLIIFLRNTLITTTWSSKMIFF